MPFRLSRALGAVAVLASTLLVVVGSTPSADAAPATSCGFGAGGAHASAICWFDMTGFDDALASSGGQTMTFAVGDYVVSARVTDTQTGSTKRTMVAVPPIGTSIGAGGYYAGIPGNPVLYTNQGTTNAGNRITLTNVSVSLDGQPVTGAQLVAAHAETLDAYQAPFGEYVRFQSDVPLTVIDHAPTFTTGGGCPIPVAGDGSSSVACYAASAGQTGANGVIVAATSPSAISAEVGETTRGEREGVAFGILTASVDVTKQVEGRVDAGDGFDVAIAAPGGTTLATASTGTSNAAATGSEVVIPGGSFTLTDAPTPGNGAVATNYDTTWDCTNAATSGTVLPSGAAATQTIDLVAGDDVSCTVTNAAKVASIELLKTVDIWTLVAGESATFSFVVTNTGDLPLDDVGVTEGAFHGSAGLLPATCPGTTLAPGASMTCTAPYVVTQADVDDGVVTNTATAQGTPPGTTTPVVSPPSTAVVTGTHAPAITLAKAADRTEASPGELITYTLTAVNTGNQTLTDVTIAEGPFTGVVSLSPLDCPAGQPLTLAPGASTTCTATYTVQAGDLLGGSLINEAMVTAMPDGSVSANAAAEVAVVEPPTTTTSTTTSTTVPTTSTTVPATTSTTTSTTVPTTSTTTSTTTVPTTTSTTTSTTVPTTTSTSVPTTTSTSVPTTSTTGAPASTTSSTPATTIASTSTSGAVLGTGTGPGAPTGPVPGAANGGAALPRTGSDLGAQVVVGAGLVLAGIVAVSRSRRLRQA